MLGRDNLSLTQIAEKFYPDDPLRLFVACCNPESSLSSKNVEQHIEWNMIAARTSASPEVVRDIRATFESSSPPRTPAQATLFAVLLSTVTAVEWTNARGNPSVQTGV